MVLEKKDLQEPNLDSGSQLLGLSVVGTNFNLYRKALWWHTEKVSLLAREFGRRA